MTLVFPRLAAPLLASAIGMAADGPAGRPDNVLPIVFIAAE